MITTSVRFVPKMRLACLPPPSLPAPYDGNISIRGYAASSCWFFHSTILHYMSWWKRLFLENKNIFQNNNNNNDIQTWAPRITASLWTKRVKWLVRLKLPVSHFPGGTISCAPPSPATWLRFAMADLKALVFIVFPSPFAPKSVSTALCFRQFIARYSSLPPPLTLLISSPTTTKTYTQKNHTKSSSAKPINHNAKIKKNPCHKTIKKRKKKKQKRMYMKMKKERFSGIEAELHCDFRRELWSWDWIFLAKRELYIQGGRERTTS